MNSVERISLHLRRPTTDALFQLDPSVRPSPPVPDAEEVDKSSGLTYGALERDWIVSTETAKAVAAICRAAAPDNYATGEAILLAMRADTGNIVGALVTCPRIRYAGNVSPSEGINVKLLTLSKE